MDDEEVSSEPLSTETIFDVLSHRYRRFLLVELQAQDRPQAVADLAEAVAGQDLDVAPDEVPNDRIKKVYTSLYHAHLPKLEDVDAITVNGDQNTVALTERGERLCSFFDCLR